MAAFKFTKQIIIKFTLISRLICPTDEIHHEIIAENVTNKAKKNDGNDININNKLLMEEETTLEN